MPSSPFLVLVDPRAQRRTVVRQRFLSFAVGLALAGACAIPYVLTLLR